MGYNMIEGKKIFITGGRGFIASHLCEKLVKKNRVVLYDNCHRDAMQHTDLLANPNVTFIKGDVLDMDALTRSMEGADLVVHCAAIAGVDSVVRKPITTMKINLLGTVNALDAAAKNRVPQFVDFSTSEVYGPSIYKASEDGLTTQGPVGESRWTYAVSKLAGEHMAHCYAEEHGMRIVTIRPFNVYGPRQVGEGAIQRFVPLALRNQDLVIHGDGTQIRAWCYIDDFVDGWMRAAEAENKAATVFNIGNPQATITTLELAKRVISLAGSSSRVVFKDSSIADVAVRVPSIAKAQQQLGFMPQVGLDEGLTRTIEYFRKVM